MAKAPLLLAGPIVRRVEPELACVWVALTQPRFVRLEIWTGTQMVAGAPSPRYTGTPQASIKVGPNLHIAFALVQPATALDHLQPEQIYSYHLSFATNAAGPFNESLATEGLLQDDTALRRLALGYEKGRLPTFVLPPKNLEGALKVLHGSCRRPAAAVPDAMVFVDDEIRGTRDDAKKRPHQLFLSGDQIYADDVASTLFTLLHECGKSWVGIENVPTNWPGLAKGKSSFKSVDTFFPPRLRKRPILKDACFTTSDGANHLISLGDFAAHYILVWNGEMWGELPKVDDYVAGVKSAAEKLIAQDDIDDVSKVALYHALAEIERPKPDENGKPARYEFGEKYEAEIKELTAFRDGLPKVRRALANVSTYMMFDDHEITDDWFLSAAWKDRVLTSPLGRTVFRNGLIAYALFQGWGNDPLALTRKDSPHAALRAEIEKLVPISTPGPFTPPAAVVTKLEAVLGLSGESETVARWHYSVGGPKHHVFVLDARMRRSYRSRLAGPGNVSAAALKEQIPDNPLPAGVEVVLVVSSLTVLGPPVVDALLGPMLYRAFDLKSFVKEGDEHAGIAGLDPDAIEGWPNDDVAFEGLLARVQPFRRVVFLSGDVHFATSAAMTYFKKGAPPTRIAQFTSSGLKNTFSAEVMNMERTLAFSQRLATEGVHMERLGWADTADNIVTLPTGKSVRPALRSKLKSKPVLLPTHGWPEGTKSAASEWAWRMEIVEDTRPTEQRPKFTHPEPLFAGQPAKDVANDAEGLRRVAARHAAQLNRFTFGRRLLFSSNLGVVTFARTGGATPQLTAVHELRARSPADTESQVYTRHEVKLEPSASESMPRIGGAP